MRCVYVRHHFKKVKEPKVKLAAKASWRGRKMEMTSVGAILRRSAITFSPIDAILSGTFRGRRCLRLGEEEMNSDVFLAKRKESKNWKDISTVSGPAVCQALSGNFQTLIYFSHVI